MILIAHRGDPRHAPENTLASFRAAAARGARAVEMDVRRRADGSWVVFHDPIPARMKDEPILEVSDALAFCRSKRLEVYLDVKEARAESSLSQILRESGWLRRTHVLAGRPSSLRRWRRLIPGRPLFWVTGFRSSVTSRAISQASRLGVTGFVSYQGRVTATTVERTHRAGLKLYVWTVRTAADLKRFTRLQVDGILSEVWPHPLPCPPKADGPSGRSRRRNRTRRMAG